MDRAERMIQFIETLRIPEGMHAGSPFVLRPWQKQMIHEVYGPVDASGRRIVRTALYTVPKKNGKGLALDTPLPTPSGWTTMGDVQLGDVLYDESGQECRVVFVSDHRVLDCYKITFSNEETIICDGDHLWPVSARIDCPGSRSRAKADFERIRDTREIFRTQFYGKHKNRNYSLKMPLPITGTDKSLPLDPYVLGVWLGDGEAGSARISCGAQDVAEIRAAIEACGIPTTARREHTCWRVRLSSGRGGAMDFKVQSRLRTMGVLHNKRIPPEYLRASPSQRLALLQGLMDTDGTCDRLGRSQEWATTKRPLLDGFCELLASLGIKFSVREKPLRCNGVDVPGTGFYVQFCALRDILPVFRLARKLVRQRLSSDRVMKSRSRSVQIVSVDAIPPVVTKCIRVDSPSNLFLCGRTMLPTHNTPLVSGLGLGHLCGPEAKRNAQAYSAAFGRDQAAITYRYMRQMVEMDEELASRLVVRANAKEIEDPVSGSIFKALSSETKGKHGLGPAFLIFDELAQFGADREFYDILNQGRGAHEEPLVWIISTQAPDDNAVLSELIDYGRKVNAGEISDPTFKLFEWSAPEDADPHDPKVWAMCNPALGDFLSLADMQEQSRAAKNMPSAEASFRNLRLNQRIDSSAHFITPSVWKANGGEADMSVLEEGACFGGLDLSAKNDLTALVFVSLDGSGVWHVLPMFWTPKDNIREREARDKVPYTTWERQGFLEAVPGKTIDYRYIARALAEFNGRLNIAGIKFDRWRVADLQRALQEEGVDAWIEGQDEPLPGGLRLIPHGQGFKDMNPAVEVLEDALIEGRIRHGMHPVLTMCASNTRVQSDPAGGRKFDKLKSTGRIDGIVALSMALNGAASGAIDPVESGLVDLSRFLEGNA